MSTKPADFFVGVIDFFSVLLPGAVVAALLHHQLATFESGAAFLEVIDGEAQGWIAFLIGAYLVGSFLFLAGAALDSMLYDPLRRLFVNPAKDQAHDRARAIRARVFASDEKTVNTFQWARATLKLLAPAALAEIERYEADSKFFRSLVVAVYAILVVHLWPVTDSIQGKALLFLPVWLLIGSRIVHAAADQRKKEEPNPRKWPEARAYAAGVVVVMTVLVYGLSAPFDWPSLVLVTLLVLSVWRYAERRWKSTKAAYTYAVVLYDQLPVRAAGDKPSAAAAVVPVTVPVSP